MSKKLLHTPEGVRDIYNSEMERKMFLQDKLNKLIQNYGFQAIQTPSFEFFDIFGYDIGTTPSKELFKFFDREGNTLVLRPDITPSIARAAAKYYMDEKLPLRFSYLGNTFTNNSSYQGRLKESTQIGAELIGDAGVDADAEMIALVIDCFLNAGLSEFQISIGHVGFFNALCAAAGIDEETKKSVRDLILTKNYFGAQELIEELPIDARIKEIFSCLPLYSGSMDSIEKAKRDVSEIPNAISSIERLEQVYQILTYYGYEKYVSFDLGFLNAYDYYTGIIFDGYTFGSGEAVAKGGRYDELLRYFGKESAAVGCVILMDQLLLALERQNITIETKTDRTMILFNEEKREQAVLKSQQMRKNGLAVILMAKDPMVAKADYEAYAFRNGITEIITME